MDEKDNSNSIEIVDSISEKSSKKNILDKELNKINKTESNIKKIFSKKSRNKSHKINIIINLDTIAYDILKGPLDNKNRTYEKISDEIKRIENKNELEKIKLQKQIKQLNLKITEKEAKIKTTEENNDDDINNDIFNDKLNLQTKKLLLLELERNKKFNYIDVVQKLQILPEKRKLKDILRIKTYIEQSNLGKYLKEEFPDMNLVEKLINFCCIEMQYKNYRKGDILYKIGEPPNFFYSIIFGKINVLKPVEKHELLTGFEYFNYLMKLKKNKEKYMFNQCIKNNKINFFIEQKDSEIIHYIYLLNYLEFIKDKIDMQLELDKILDIIDIKPNELGINENMINSNTYIHNHIKSIKKKIPNISEITLNKYSFIKNYIIKKEVITYEYRKISELKSNDYFGEYDIENNLIRNETIIAEERTEIAYLPNKLYYNQIAIVKAKELEHKMYYLHTKFFFNKIKYIKFSKKYYRLFIKQNYVKDDILFNEDEKIKYLYFIKKGNVQLYTSKSMNEIEKLINLLIEKKSENKEKEITKDNFFSYTQVSSNNKDIFKYINEKQLNKLIILNNNEDIGVVSYYLGNKYLSSCVVKSNTAEIYKLDIKYMKIMFNNEYEFKDEFIKRMKKKLELLSERLFKINNIKLIMTDDKINIENKELYEKKLENDKILAQNNSNNNKIIINYDKINNLLNNSKNNSLYLNLPVLNINKKNDIKKPLFDNNNNLNNSYINKKINSYKKKELIIEDSIIKRINEDIKYFTEDKYTISKDKIKIRNKINSIKSYKSKNSNIIHNNNYSISRNDPNELFNNSNNNTISNLSLEKINIPKILKYKNNYEKKFLCGDEDKNNLGINLFGEKINRLKKRSKEKYNHPFIETKTLFKKEKYKIFERSNINNEMQNDLFKTHIQRLKELKKLHLSMQKSPRNIINNYKFKK